jgi:alkylation response protein AidB-like acyl-CoA dehydrogenase
MDFGFSAEHDRLRRTVREFALNELAPLAQEIDASRQVPPHIVNRLRELGLFGAPFPQEVGGLGTGEIGYCIVMEELAQVCGGTTAMVGAHTGIGAMAVYLDGTEAQKEEYLAGLARGTILSAFALTEPGAGSDAANMKTTALPDGDEFVLNGGKIYITIGDLADIVIVFARTPMDESDGWGLTAFIVRSDNPGFSVVRTEDKLGNLGAHAAELSLDDCRVPRESVLGKYGRGFITAMKTLDVARVSLAACCLGQAEAAFKISVDHAVEHQTSGGPLAHSQSVQWLIADMSTEIEALRSLVYRVAWLVDQGERVTQLASISKLYGSEVATRSVNRAIKVVGTAALEHGSLLERLYRDVRVNEIVEGTSEIQRIVIAGSIFRESGVRISP